VALLLKGAAKARRHATARKMPGKLSGELSGVLARKRPGELTREWTEKGALRRWHHGHALARRQEGRAWAEAWRHVRSLGPATFKRAAVALLTKSPLGALRRI
jgi:hypothetical protein